MSGWALAGVLVATFTAGMVAGFGVLLFVIAGHGTGPVQQANELAHERATYDRIWWTSE